MNRIDLLERLIKSIDYRVDRLIVGFQSPTDEILEYIYKVVSRNTNILSYHYISFSYNVGVSYGWNRIIELCNDFDYIIIPGDDIIFDKDTLQNTERFMTENPNIIIGGYSCLNFKDKKDEKYSPYACFIFTKKTKEVVGMFDENFYPAYFEDNDHFRRILNSNNDFTILPFSVTHGDDKNSNSCTFHTIDREYQHKMKVCFEKNRLYFKKKWGFHKDESTKLIFNEMFDGNKDLLNDFKLNKWRNENLLFVNNHINSPTIFIKKYDRCTMNTYKPKIAILYCGQIRNNPIGFSEIKRNDILESINTNFISDDFKLKYDYDIFISVDNLHLSNTHKFFGTINIKNIHLYDTGYYLTDIERKIQRYEYYLEMYNNFNDYNKEYRRYPTSVWQYYRLYDCFNLLENYTDYKNYDYIIRSRTDTYYKTPVTQYIDYLEKNKELQLIGKWDHFAVGRPEIMKEYCQLINSIGTYDKHKYNHNFKQNLVDHYGYYNKMNAEQWTYAPETQLFEHLYNYCNRNNINIDNSIKNADICNIIR